MFPLNCDTFINIHIVPETYDLLAFSQLTSRGDVINRSIRDPKGGCCRRVLAFDPRRSPNGGFAGRSQDFDCKQLFAGLRLYKHINTYIKMNRNIHINVIKLGSKPKKAIFFSVN